MLKGIYYYLAGMLFGGGVVSLSFFLIPNHPDSQITVYVNNNLVYAEVSALFIWSFVMLIIYPVISKEKVK
jgi:hypothetical protein